MSVSARQSSNSSLNIIKFDRFKPDTAQKWLVQAEEYAQGHEQAKDQMRAQGLPTPKLERWKYSNLSNALRKLDVTAKNISLEIAGVEADGVISPMYESGPEPDLSMLNAAFVKNKRSIKIPRGKILEEPVHINWIGQNGALQAEAIDIHVEDSADVTIIEHQSGKGSYWKNLSSNIVIGKNARVRHYRFVQDDTQSVETLIANVHIDRDAVYEGFTITTGAGFSCHETHIHINGSNAEAGIYGLTMLREKQHADTTVRIYHNAPHCRSHQLFKTILDDQSRGVFQGKIFVDRAAQQTDGYQLSNNILLSPLAEMNIKPELEIYADDVKCSHGTTTGQLDETPLFYMRSRGIPEQDARKILIESFLTEAVDRISCDSIKETVLNKVWEWLG